MKKFVKASVLLLLFFSMMGVAQAQKFGYVNSAAILAEMPEVKQADANLEALQKQLQKKGQGMVEKLQQDYAAVRQKVDNGELSPLQQQQESDRLEKAQADIAKFEQDMVKQVQDKREELLQPIYDKVNTAIADVAKENGFQFIFDQGVLLYAEESQDVSTMVRAKLGM
ncbi:MAG: OmpH family outer membrane protein [Phaeodactylibacter sp.]|nr:OmpH family outer membrane protein [Phaeodactylibacter sp.]MCB9304903.1 OmpH family outer membrane protein [Lewinellaceae bacterium]HQU57542.1 OmpH family outer membrane protein [Saprospiraceae bacterium]